jgi:ribonuclease HI
MSWGYFDGSCQGPQAICGVGGIMHLTFKAGLGSTNNFTDPIALKLLMKLAVHKDVQNLQAFGNSAVVVNLMNGQIRMANMFLLYYLRMLKKWNLQFLNISYHHIFRGLNLEADGLSKTSLLLDDDVGFGQEVKGVV